jgi:1-acyl-sn-glycerol-3-phosphate acyltransferase
VRLASRIVSPAIKRLLGLLCRIDAGELAAIPRRGPLIMVTNHINFLEVPLLYTFLYPRELIGMIKAETWKNPLLGALADIWGAIPLDRDATDLSAMRKALEALGVAPEGTRSGHGRLQPGHSGIVTLALKSGAPIVPVAHFGGESFWTNFRKGRRTPFRIRVGEPFRLRAPGRGEARRARAEATDEIMNRLALLLPPWYRGAYPSPEGFSCRHLDFLGAT